MSERPKFRFRVPMVCALLAAQALFAGDCGVNLYFQEQTRWCWAAADAMVRDYWGDNISQCDDAQIAASQSVCLLTPAHNCCGDPASCNELCSPRIQSSSLHTDYVAGVLSWAEIVNQVNNCWPFIYGYVFPGGGLHYRVGRGTRISAFGTPQIKTNDPNPVIGGVIYVAYWDYSVRTNEAYYNIHW